MTSKIEDGGPVPAEEVVRNALRDATLALLMECTADQVEFFHHIQNSSPWRGFDNCPSNKLSLAYELVRRTVIKSRRNAA